LICEEIETERFTRKLEDVREADFRLANRRLQPLGHLTADFQVYPAIDSYTAARDSEVPKALRIQKPPPFDAKRREQQ
jgi:hypothetical protein